MASTDAIRFVEGLLQRADSQTRHILANEPRDTEVDTINVIIGDGTVPIVSGVAAAIRADFRSRITGAFLQEFDGNTGSVAITVAKAQGGPSPVWSTISSGLAISSSRYFADEDCSTWSQTYIERGDYLRFSVGVGATIARVHLTLRIRRLEP